METFELTNDQKRIQDIIRPLFELYNENITPATPDEISRFREMASQLHVPQVAIDELIKFYEVSNGIPCLDSISISKIDDELLFEPWEDGELWFGQRDMDMIRWAQGKFHLGHAGDLNYGSDYVFNTILEVLQKGFEDWYPEHSES